VKVAPATRPTGVRKKRSVSVARTARQELERILLSPDFDASRRSRDFLCFVLDEALAGRGEELTQAAIATRVFGRKDDFDPLLDPIVRIQAGRLRRSLERYYLLGGKGDPVRIDLPKGGYVPVFRHVEASGTDAPALVAVSRPEAGGGPAASTAMPAPDGTQLVAAANPWPTIAVRPFELAAGDAAHQEIVTRLEDEVTVELVRYHDARIVPQWDGERLASAHCQDARFELRGRIRHEAGDFVVTAHLVDCATGEHVWGDDYHTTAHPGRWAGTVEDIARVIAARVGAEEGIVTQLLATERRKRKTAALTPYDAMLLSYEFFLARDPETLAPALEALRQAVKADPECGQAWTRLARVCLANHAFEVTSIPTPIDDTITYAHHGVRVDPSSRRARCILAAALLVKGELPSAREELEQALRLSNDSLVYLEVIGYFLTLAGDERGPVLIRTAFERNPHCLPNATMGLWFDYLRRGETKLAYQTALEFRDPTFFWRGVMRASSLGLLGRTEEARVEVADLLHDKPDFGMRGRTLIGYYIKPPKVMDLVVGGLEKAGLALA
jgi:adenylate cyclase